MVNWIYYILLLLISAAGLFVTILGLPGLWLMVGVTTGYALLTHWNHFVGWPSVGTLLGLATLSEIMEFVASAAGSKAAGGRKRGMLGGIVGALLGGIFLSIVPVPIVSTIVGVCVGAFIGASLMEFTDKRWDHAIRVGVGAAKGRFAGIVIKLSIGIAMLIIIIAAALPL